MKFLLDANMPRSAAGILRVAGHEAEDVRDVLPDGTADQVVARHAQSRKRILVTRDFDFADIRNYPPQNYSGILVLTLPDDATAADINQLLKSFIQQPALLEKLSGRLAVVDKNRVRYPPI
jgi:predicted nuclease of predicted toxin-antitoxin system